MSLTISALVIGSVYGLIALGYSLIYSASGLMTFCQGKILMFGAFVGLSFYRYLNWPFGIALLAAMLVMFLIGILIERLLIRPILSKQAQDIYVVLATIALGIVLTNSAQQIWGTTAVQFPAIFGYHLHSKLSFAIFTFLMINLFVFLKQRIIHSSTGRAFMAIRENTVAAGGMGIDVRKYKILAFILSVIFVSFAGALYTHFVRFISPETFNSTQSTLFMTMLSFGGMGNPVGPILGFAILAILNESLQSFNTYKTLIYGV